MKTRFLQFSACLIFLLLCIPQNATATHMVGEDITWECINNCTTRVYLKVYRDCSGVTAVTNNITFTATTPGCISPNALGNWSPQATVEVTPICPSLPTLCSTPGAPINGIEEYLWFRDYNVCSVGANCTFDVSWGSCCRNTSITSGASNQGMAVVNYMDLSMGCNNSPQFTNYPLFMACAGTPYTIHQGAYDPDGDSLAYALAACINNTTMQPVTYTTGYSPTAPLGPSWNIAFDPVTGILNLLPNPGNIVVGVICFEVSEYRNGILIGSTFRDMQVQVLACPTNAQPAYNPITNLSAGAAMVSPDVISVCAGTPLCFNITATDADSASQAVRMYWDGNISGASFSQVGNPFVVDTISGNSPDGQFCWANPTLGVHQFLISAEDNACPIFGLQDKLITILVTNGGIPTPLITATGMIDTCSGATVTLTATSGYANYLWSNSATTQSITVSTAGVYSVSASNPTGCPAIDSYTAVDMSTPEITGTITTSTSAALANQKVYLITHDFTNNSLTARDSTTTDATGSYAFCGVPFDSVYVKAAPDSATYPMEMPTYADTAVFWNNARPILSVNFPTVVNFSTRFGSNPGGPGFIGGLISQGANKRQGPGDPMPNVKVILRSNTSGQLIDETISDVNGYFFFANIPLDDYKISVDVAGVDDVSVPTVLLDAQTPVKDNLDFRLHTTYLELYTPVAVTPPGLAGLRFEAFPNPSNAASTILLALETDTEARIQVYDLKGRAVKILSSKPLTAGEHRFTFDPVGDGRAAGIYFIRLEAPGISKTIKFVALEK